MKIIDTIKKKYFPHKVKLVKGEQRTYLTDLDKSFIYACKKLNLLNNRLGWYHPQTEINWLDDYKANKYDFFKFNVEVQAKCWETGHLKEIVRQMVMKLSEPTYWSPFFKLMEIFDHKEYKLGFKIYQFAKDVALANGNILLLKVLDYVLEDNLFRTYMGWERVYRAFKDYFQVEDESENNYNREQEYYKSEPQQETLRNKYLRVLGISINSTKTEIKAFYRKLVLKHHPDKGGSPEKFREITEAYEYLINN